MTHTAKPTAELIACLRGLAALRQDAVNRMPAGFMPPAQAKATADVGTLTASADRLETILKAWEAFDSAPDLVKWQRRRELYFAITGTSAEVRG